jgi:hypothetical protein
VTIYCGIHTKSAFLVFFLSSVCFKVFDIDRDGVLSEEELQHMVDVLLFVCHENKTAEELASDPFGQAGE